MSEDNTKQIIQESLLSPSDDFTNSLMAKIALEKKPVRIFPWSVLLLSLFCLAFVIYLGFTIGVEIPEMSIYNYTFNISPIYIQIIGSLFILYVISQIHYIYRNILVYKQSNLA